MLRRKLAIFQAANAHGRLNQEGKSASSQLPDQSMQSTTDNFDAAKIDLFKDATSSPTGPAIGHVESMSTQFQPPERRVHGNQSPPMALEWPPASKVDFDWNEQGIPMAQRASEVDENTDNLDFIDGMASLSVNEGDAGYLGVASGAALLRMLQPGGSAQSPSATLRQGGPRQHLLPSLSAQPDANIHIIDAMIDGYFRTYHISYPIIYEPRFRAQYSEVIARPEGNGWKALVNMVASLGAFSTSSGPSSIDGHFFNLAKSQLSIDDLESGNTSFVQALALMSNYLQKRNKPNSGYNYLGLSLRMAMGLGLYKEFPKWEISPLELEIRRRVWWTLFVFDVGATITFSRSLGWPTEGVEVALPLNIHDRVRSCVSFYTSRL
jgi:transcriptional regulatory protein GAL4